MKTSTCLLLLTVSTWLCGCGAVGVNFKSESVHHLFVGKTMRVQVDSLLGKPSSEEKLSITGLESTIYFYGYARKSFGLYETVNKKSLYLEFIDDTLNGYVFNNSFDDASTDFNSDLRKQLATSKSTKQDAMTTLGRGSGIINVPSNLPKRVFPEEFTSAQPKETKNVLVYLHNYLEELRGGGRLGNQYKLLVLYFDDAGVLLDQIYTENTSR